MSLLSKHGLIERNAFLLLVLSFIVVTIGGIVQIVPLFYLENTIEDVEGVRPYSPLELAGRNIYVREGCYVCHSQMVRPMRDEVDRYGHYSLAAESQYDHPFQWGSKRTGPDLARVGGRYSDDWHIDHFQTRASWCRSRSCPPIPGSRPPRYRRGHQGGMLANRMTGVPYSDEMLENARADFAAQADPDTGDVDALLARYPKAQARNFDGQPGVSELDAVIAYLQMLGTLVDFRPSRPTPAARAGPRWTPTPPSGLRRQLGARALFVVFVGIVIWVFRPGARKAQTTPPTYLLQRRQAQGRRQCHSGKSTPRPRPRPPGTSGTGSRSSTRRCRAGGCGPSTPPSSGAWSG